MCKVGLELMATLRTVIRRMVGYMEYLLCKLFDDAAIYEVRHERDNLTLALTTVTRLVIWLVASLIALGMSTILLHHCLSSRA